VLLGFNERFVKDSQDEDPGGEVTQAMEKEILVFEKQCLQTAKIQYFVFLKIH
jgi:hypothetical protein